MSRDLSEILGSIEQRAAQAERDEAIAPVHRVLRSVLEDFQHVELGNGAQPESNHKENPDVLLKIGDAAVRLGMTKDWLYDHHTELPFATKIGRQVRFSERGLATWLKRQRR